MAVLARQTRFFRPTRIEVVTVDEYDVPGSSVETAEGVVVVRGKMEPGCPDLSEFN